MTLRSWISDSRGDGRGVIFLVDAKTEDEARVLMETLPLAKEQLMDYEYIPVGPLMPAGRIDRTKGAAVTPVR
jgi:hypothetical protein